MDTKSDMMMMMMMMMMMVMMMMIDDDDDDWWLMMMMMMIIDDDDDDAVKAFWRYILCYSDKYIFTRKREQFYTNNSAAVPIGPIET